MIDQILLALKQYGERHKRQWAALRRESTRLYTDGASSSPRYIELVLREHDLYHQHEDAWRVYLALRHGMPLEDLPANARYVAYKALKERESRLYRLAEWAEMQAEGPEWLIPRANRLRDAQQAADRLVGLFNE